MTLESAFPWISATSALAAALVAPGSRRGRWLRTGALAALALYAYFRWITPTSVPMALACQALGQALLPEGAGRWRRWAIGLPVLGWLILANLFRTTGDGPGMFVQDAAKAGLFAALAIAAGYGLWSAWRWTRRPRAGVAAEAIALLVMAGMGLTLDWEFWPVMAGALAALAACGVALYAARAGTQAPSPALARAAWICSFAGQAAMAYSFLR